MMTTKKKVFQILALNNKQLWLCYIMTRLPLIKCNEYEYGDIVGYLLESPITGRPLCIWWHAECLFIVYKIFFFIWGSRICFDEEAEQHYDELVKLGWITENEG